MTRVLPYRPTLVGVPELDLSGKGDALAPRIRYGLGAPEGKVPGITGDWYLRRDGGAGSTLYVKEPSVYTPTTVFSENCTAADGSAISGRAWNPATIAWENGIGAFALGASIQSNRIERTAVGGGQQTQHNVVPPAPPAPTPFNDFEYSAELWRPADGVNQQAGLVLRGVGFQYNGVGNDGIYFYWDRVSSTLVDLKIRVQKNGSDFQQVTVVSNFPLAQNAAIVLGAYVTNALIQLWTEPAGRAGSRTWYNAVTLTPDVFNDTNHRYIGAWLRMNATAYRFDDFRVATVVVSAGTPSTGWKGK